MTNVWECPGCHRVFGFFTLDMEPKEVPSSVTCPVGCVTRAMVKLGVCDHANPCVFPKACARCPN